MNREIVCIPGDGIGPEVTDAMKRVVKVLDVEIRWINMLAGEAAMNAYGDPLPQATIDAILEHRLAIKGPTTTPIGGGWTSANVQLRQKCDLHAGIRPFRSLPIPGTVQGVNNVVARQNTEGLYLLKEVISGPPGKRRVTLIAQFTEEAMTRLARLAFAYALEEGIGRVTYVDKGNIHKVWGAMYHDAFRAVAAEPAFAGIRSDHMLVDAIAMRLVMAPGEYGVLVTENLMGDILSDECAGLVGGLGVAAGANIGDDIALFEAVHGSAPDIAGKGIANPTALLRSAGMMLGHMGLHEEQHRLEAAIRAIYLEGRYITGDLAWRYGVDPSNTRTFTDALIDRIRHPLP